LMQSSTSSTGKTFPSGSRRKLETVQTLWNRRKKIKLWIEKKMCFCFSLMLKERDQLVIHQLYVEN
jgi:hypothetical protein